MRDLEHAAETAWDEYHRLFPHRSVGWASAGDDERERWRQVIAAFVIAYDWPGTRGNLALLDEIVHFGVLAADWELLGKPPPVSSVRNPNGSLQHETAAERTRRIVRTAVRHLVQIGLLAIPDDAQARMEAGVPLDPGHELPGSVESP